MIFLFFPLTSAFPYSEGEMIWSCLIQLPHCHRILSHFKIGLILKNNISLHQHLPAEGGARDLKAFIIPMPGLKPLFPFFFLKKFFLCRKMTIPMGMLFHAVDADFRD